MLLCFACGGRVNCFVLMHSPQGNAHGSRRGQKLPSQVRLIVVSLAIRSSDRVTRRSRSQDVGQGEGGVREGWGGGAGGKWVGQGSEGRGKGKRVAAGQGMEREEDGVDREGRGGKRGGAGQGGGGEKNAWRSLVSRTPQLPQRNLASVLWCQVLTRIRHSSLFCAKRTQKKDRNQEHWGLLHNNGPLDLLLGGCTVPAELCTALPGGSGQPSAPHPTGKAFHCSELQQSRIQMELSEKTDR